jgi:hypothetical protein
MSTTTQEVPREQWSYFFDVFSRRHQDWLATLEVLAPDIGAQVAGESLRFACISADLKDSENTIAIALGATPEAHMTHLISDPARVTLERSELDRGTFETLAVESADGTRTLVRFLCGEIPDVPGYSS